jgi:hypothetical protein
LKVLKTISKALGLPFGAVQPFPEISEVFAEEQQAAAQVLFPICSIDLSYINRAYRGNVYLLQFNEDPYNDATKVFFNQYCKFNTIGFRMNDGKYEFLTDYRYFDVTDSWKEWKELTQRTYLEAKQAYQQNGKKYWINFIIPGGKPDWKQEDQTPTDPDGSPMTFIAQYDTGQLCKDNCEKEIYLFYSEKHQLAVQVYQTS